MARFRGLVSGAIMLLVLPAAALAQGDNKHTREASKHIGLAMTRQDEAERAEMYREALAALEKGMAEEPDHAKTWFLAGPVYAALGQYAKADSAFERAVQLYPEYAQDIAPEREQAWVYAFNAGVAAMDAQDYPSAITAMESAIELYPDRPEAYLNLGSLYANQGEPQKAVEVLTKAQEVLKGPLLAELPEETKAEWARYSEMAGINIAQMSGQAGVQAFQEQDYPGAAAMFKAAADQNPHSRDFRYNYVQALFAQAQALEEQRDSARARQESATGDAQARAAAQVEHAEQELVPIYAQLLEGFNAVQPLDPNNEMLYLIAARAVRMRGILTGDAAAQKAGQDSALALLTVREELPVEIAELTLRPAGETTEVSGQLTNRNVAEGANVVVHLVLVGMNGNPVGEADITVAAPAVDSAAAFQATVPTAGEIAGWRYEVRP